MKKDACFNAKESGTPVFRLPTVLDQNFPLIGSI